MLAQQGIGIWSLVNGAGNASPDLSVDELMVQGQVCQERDMTFSREAHPA